MLARGRKLSVSLSTFVALVASLNGWIICWGASDRFGALGAFTWLPWAWWAGERALDPKRSRWRFLWPAPFVYLLIAGGFPYTVLMLALVLACCLAPRTLFEARTVDTGNPTRTRPGGLAQLTRIGPILAGVTLGLGLAAPACLALLDYVHGSARESLHPSAHWQWLVPWNAWPGLILPSWTVNWSNFLSRSVPHGATELACGLVPPAALLTGFLVNGRALLKKIRWEMTYFSSSSFLQYSHRRSFVGVSAGSRSSISSSRSVPPKHSHSFRKNKEVSPPSSCPSRNHAHHRRLSFAN